jgi:arylsulfatase A-like enzyme
VGALFTCAVGTVELLLRGGLPELAGLPMAAAAHGVSRVLALHLLAGGLVGLAALVLSAVWPRWNLVSAALVLSWVILLPLLPALRELTVGMSLPVRVLIGLSVMVVVLTLSVAALRAARPILARRTSRWPSRVAMMLFVGLGGVWGATAVWHGTSSGGPNVILISLDTVRADHLQPYGYPRPTSPTLNRFASEAVVFTEAFAPEPWTLPSHMTMMTGLHPLRHGVRTRQSRLAGEVTTIAEALGSRGYRSYAFVASGPTSWVGGMRGFADGFDRYHHPPHWRTRTLGTSLLEITFAPFAPGAGSAEDITTSAIRLLQRVEAKPFFLFLHFYDAHSDSERLPYEAPAHLLDAVASDRGRHFDGCLGERCASSLLATAGDCTPAGAPRLEPWMVEDIIAHYDAGIRLIDGYLEQIFQSLEQRGLMDNSLIVVTADHGEEFFEHGSFLHSQLHREVTHVPLMVRLPGGETVGRVSNRVLLTDLLPTILDFAGVDIPEDIDGHSLLPAISGETTQTRTLMFSNTRQGGEFDLRDLGIRAGSKLLIQRMTPRCEGGVPGDPTELHAEDASRTDDDVATRQALEEQLKEWWESIEPVGAPDAEGPVDLSPEEIERLRSLGYIGG